ncbi:MAG TPA: GH3 auxin-responsive promoter family protein, partial [Fodinibius sp.]|nr:GH3 auxin-responsive promoter family protein [Fodinibius sp.]
MSSVLPALQKQQEELLQSLVKKAVRTDFGRQHHFETIDGYAQFSKRVPIQSYQQIRPYIGQLKEGKENVFWPGKIENFAVSAGTSGKGKHLPLTDTRLESDRRFMQKVALSYLKQRP